MTLSNRNKIRIRSAYGKWAVITGATSGIGLALAEEIAAADLGLVIVGRYANTLEATRKALIEKYGIEVITVVADLADRDSIEKLISATEKLDVGLFVAAAGFGTSGRFIDGDLEDEISMLRVNCEAVLRLTAYFARRFSAKGRGGIILLSSIVAFQGMPFAANYGATKAYIQSFAEALARELTGSGVDILAAAPGPVASGFASRANMQMGSALTPAQISGPILKALGRRSTVFPGRLSWILIWLLRSSPRWGRVRIMEKIVRGFTRHQADLH